MVVAALSEATGIGDSSLRFLLSLLIGFGFGIIYRFIPRETSINIKSLFCAFGGICIAVFSYGFDTIHSLLTILVTYFLLLLIPNRTWSLVISFIFNLGYLLIAYFYVSSADSYDIDWTTPQCVLVLRLIGLSWDYHDGAKSDELNIKEKNLPLKTLPPFLQIFGFSYFFGTFLAGPQFSFQKFHQFLTHKIYEKPGEEFPAQPPCLDAVLSCLIRGIFFL